jgi:hypothetical protein
MGIWLLGAPALNLMACLPKWVEALDGAEAILASADTHAFPRRTTNSIFALPIV